MICPQCGALVDDGIEKCDNCEYIFTPQPDESVTPIADDYITNLPALNYGNNTDDKKTHQKPDIYKVIMLVLAVLIICLTFYGAHYIAQGGLNLNSMKTASVASLFNFGNGTDVSYYQNLGAVYYGIAYGIRAIGVGLSAIILAIAFKK